MKGPWIKLAAAGIAFLLAIAMIHYLSKQLPPSKVTLTYQGRKFSGTNVYEVFCLSNSGPRNIYWAENGATIFETPTGWVTNQFQHFTVLALGTPPGSNELVAVRIPTGATRWMVRVDYYSFQKHNVRLETARKIVTWRRAKDLPEFMWNFIFEGLSLFPMSKEEYHETFSEIFTNKPPDTPLDSALSH